MAADILQPKPTPVRAPSPPPPSGPKPRGKRAMDSFLEEIKQYASFKSNFFAFSILKEIVVTRMPANKSLVRSQRRRDLQ